jgi:hypothetical protein
MANGLSVVSADMSSPFEEGSLPCQGGFALSRGSPAGQAAAAGAKELGHRPGLERAAGRGVRAAPSAVSETEPSPTRRGGPRAFEQVVGRHADARAASTYGPISHGQTVPWW